MLSVEEAKKLVLQNVPTASTQDVTLLEALGHVAAEDVKTSFPIPSFDNSAMDGFVFRSADTEKADPEHPVRLAIRGMLKAGDTGDVPRGAQETYRIMTGALVPAAMDSVLPIEKAELEGETLLLRNPWPAGKNVRYRGEELKERQVVVQKGMAVSPAVVGILASLGRKKIRVYKTPNVSVIATGSELIESGSPLVRGKIYDSNLPMVRSALLQMGVRPVFTKRLADTPSAIRQVVRHALRISDIVILTGGVSAGDTDHVRPTLQRLGVETIFWRVSQKPGKPFYLGRKGKTLFFGLPGNPAAVFTCFYEYVYPAIRHFMGFKEPFLPEFSLTLGERVSADPEKSLFLKATTDFSNGTSLVTPLKGQASHMISSLAHSKGILMIPNSSSALEAGQKAVFHALPYDI